jgi:hypothetical protein
MTPTRKRNIIRAPLVVLTRIPIMVPLFLLYLFCRLVEIIGDRVEELGDWLSERLPMFEKEPHP